MYLPLHEPAGGDCVVVVLVRLVVVVVVRGRLVVVVRGGLVVLIVLNVFSTGCPYKLRIPMI